jgi:hypothetical protein
MLFSYVLAVGSGGGDSDSNVNHQKYERGKTVGVVSTYQSQYSCVLVAIVTFPALNNQHPDANCLLEH